MMLKTVARCCSTAEDFEGCKAKVFDDKLLIMLLVADRQGGVIVGWDATEGRIAQ